ncbi:MAG TPA: choice-of-anchor J domain-containing protein, partial [Anaerolineae bacterium]|nr:choice-of-anchor J domain-containing protein [Anaerolineae bacterium]
ESNDPDAGPGNGTDLVVVPLRLQVEGQPPNIDVDPLSMSSTQPANTTTQQMLNVANTGGGTLQWEIDEEDTTVFPQGPAVVDPTSAAEEATTVAAPGAPQAAPENVNVWRAPEVVLFDNGPLVNFPGAGAGGADESRLQSTSLGMNTLGFGHQVLNDNWVADDFTVSDAAGWTVDTATFFAYQTNSTTASTMTNVNWILYNGDPSAGGTMITSGSGLQASVWANMYRTSETTVGATNRPIMASTVGMGGLFLPAGTYWLAWQTDGTLASGPWAPAITINGQTVTGNGLQSLAGTAAWAPALDTGTGTPRQGFPFILEGSVGGTGQACSALSDIPWLSLSATAGSNAGGTNTDVTVTFDSTGLANGTYTGNLCVTSNDPDAGPGNGTDLVIVPVELVVEGEPPNIDVDPLALSATQPTNTTTQQTLDVGNTGGADLTWAIAEEPASVLAQATAASPAVPASVASDTGSRGAPSGGPAPIEYTSLADFSEGFDDITVLPGWFFQNNSAPLGLTDWFQGNDTVFPAQAGAPTAYIGANFNNTAGVGDISNWLLTPELNLANGDTISFWTRTADGSIWPDRLELRLSTAGASTNVGATAASVGDFTTLLLSVNPALAAGGYPEAWTQFTATLSGIPSGATGRIAFRYFVTGGGPNGNNSNYIGIDTVEYVSGQPQVCDAPSDVPWLSVSPTNGTTAPAATTPVDVTFDSTGLAAGVYNANLCVTSNDPDPGPG